MSKTIFITGGTGFVGSYLIRYLLKKRNCEIRALKRPTSSMLLVEDIKDQVIWIEGDILDIVSLEDGMQGVDEVYHCAAVVSFDPKEFDTMLRVNQEGTENVVNTALTFHIKKLIHFSSIAALGRYKLQTHYDEKTKWERSVFNSRYAISKKAAEQEVWRGIAEGLNAAIVNPSIILGSSIWGTGTTTFFKQVWKGLRFYPEGTSGFVDVRDVVKFAVQLMESDIHAKRFVLNAENWSYSQLFNVIATLLNKKPPSIKTPPWVTRLAWRGDWLISKIFGKKRLITKEIARHVSKKYTYGNERSLEVFNFKYTPLDQTLEETCNQFLEAKKSNLSAMVLPI